MKERILGSPVVWFLGAAVLAGGFIWLTGWLINGWLAS
jgi:hypothetical protein